MLQHWHGHIRVQHIPVQLPGGLIQGQQELAPLQHVLIWQHVAKGLGEPLQISKWWLSTVSLQCSLT